MLLSRLLRNVRRLRCSRGRRGPLLDRWSVRLLLRWRRIRLLRRLRGLLGNADKATADASNEKMMTDPRMQEFGDDMPFDGKRMVYGGFATKQADSTTQTSVPPTTF